VTRKNDTGISCHGTRLGRALLVRGMPVRRTDGDVRVALVDGQDDRQPTTAQKKATSLELVMPDRRRSHDGGVGLANEISEEKSSRRRLRAHAACKSSRRAQRELVSVRKAAWTVDNNRRARHRDEGRVVKSPRRAKMARRSPSREAGAGGGG